MRSFRTKLQFAFVTLGLAALAATGWQASESATLALRQSGYDRLTALRENRASELERYFSNVRSQVAALVSDTSTQLAAEQFASAWVTVPQTPSGALRDYYRSAGMPPSWFPGDPRTQSLQDAMIALNPHPAGARDLLLEAKGVGTYSSTHTRFHPTFHRYKTAFGFYDLFLISAQDARVLYTVMKEIDLGVSLKDAPYRDSPLARVFQKAMQQPGGEVVMEDYAPYAPSGMAPAAFVAAAILRAGQIEGVLAIQVSIDEVNNVMDGGRKWRDQGLGATGQAYLVGPDGTLRSDLREGIESPEKYLRDLQRAGIAEGDIERVRRNHTAVLAYPVDLAVIGRVKAGERGTEFGRDTNGKEVLRSHSPLQLAELHWAIIAEMASQEALEPVAALRRTILTTALTVALILFAAAGWLGSSVTRPILDLAFVARRIGKGERGLRIQVQSDDEIGQLAADFNRMSDNLERTTVSKQKMEVLAGRLITAQEDERRRVARELHDGFTQRLAAAAITAGVLERAAASATALELRYGLAGLKEEMAAISDEVHALSRRLHPAILDDLGLVAAIETECRAAFERSGLIVSPTFSGSPDCVSRDARLALYRVTQEALHNIQRHAETSEAELRLSCSNEGVILEIEDNGKGFDRSQSGHRSGLGLASMEERARLLGGRFALESEPGKGTVVRIFVPCQGTA